MRIDDEVVWKKKLELLRISWAIRPASWYLCQLFAVEGDTGFNEYKNMPGDETEPHFKQGCGVNLIIRTVRQQHCLPELSAQLFRVDYRLPPPPSNPTVHLSHRFILPRAHLNHSVFYPWPSQPKRINRWLPPLPDNPTLPLTDLTINFFIDYYQLATAHIRVPPVILFNHINSLKKKPPNII